MYTSSMLTLLEIRIFKNVEKCDDKFLYISNQDETGAKIDLFLVFSWTGDEEILSRSCKRKVFQASMGVF